MIRSKLWEGFGYDVDLWANGSGYFGDVIQVGRWFWNGVGSTVQLLLCAGKLLAVHFTLHLNLRRLRSLDEDKIAGIDRSLLSSLFFFYCRFFLSLYLQNISQAHEALARDRPGQN
jgi:hypothetical protein